MFERDNSGEIHISSVFDLISKFDQAAKQADNPSQKTQAAGGKAEGASSGVAPGGGAASIRS
jgi:hypothetical protein